MFYLIKFNLIYFFIIIIFPLILLKYEWTPIKSKNLILKKIFLILKLINLKKSILFILFFNLIILIKFFNFQKKKIIKIIFYILFIILLEQYIKYNIKIFIKKIRPYILYIIKKNNKKNIYFLKLTYLKKNELIKNVINDDIINIDFKFNLINNYYSFPSGHTLILLNNSLINIILIYKFKKYIYIIFLLLNTIIIYSRIILGMHYPIDIIFGIILHFILFILITFIFNFFDFLFV